MKLFLWPLVFWLLGTRRWAAAAMAIAAACASLLVPWAAIGFTGFLAYPASSGWPRTSSPDTATRWSRC